MFIDGCYTTIGNKQVKVTMELDNFVRRGRDDNETRQFCQRGEMTLMQNFFSLARSQSSLWLGIKTYIVNMSTKCIYIYIVSCKGSKRNEKKNESRTAVCPRCC